MYKRQKEINYLVTQLFTQYFIIMYL